MTTPPALRSALLTAVVLLAATACSAPEDSKADVRDRVEAQLRANGLDDDAATCVAEVLVDELGKDAIQDVDLGASEPEGSLDTDLTEAALSARATCKIDLSQLTG